MNVVFDRNGWQDYTTWAGEPRILRRIHRMIEESTRDATSGIGKPERLSENLSGYFSRRITDEHRLVYTVKGDNLIIIQARGHY